MLTEPSYRFCSQTSIIFWQYIYICNISNPFLPGSIHWCYHFWLQWFDILHLSLSQASIAWPLLWHYTFIDMNYQMPFCWGAFIGFHHLSMKPFTSSYLSIRLGCWQNPFLGSAHRPASDLDNRIIFIIYQIFSFAAFIGVYHFCKCNDLIDYIYIRAKLR